MSLAFTGEDKDQIRDILNSITRNYLEQNVERKSAEAAKSLAFLAKQLPEVRSRLDVAENKLNAFRQDKDSVDLPLEALFRIVKGESGPAGAEVGVVVDAEEGVENDVALGYSAEEAAHFCCTLVWKLKI